MCTNVEQKDQLKFAEKITWLIFAARLKNRNSSSQNT